MFREQRGFRKVVSLAVQATDVFASREFFKFSSNKNFKLYNLISPFGIISSHRVSI